MKPRESHARLLIRPALAIVAAVVLGLPAANPTAAHDVGGFIPGLAIERAVARMEGFGLQCVPGSAPNAPDPPPGMVGADCEGSFESESASVTALLNYWPDGHVATIFSTVSPIAGAAFEDVDPSFANEWARYLARTEYDRSDPERASSWVDQHSDQPECEQGCSIAIGPVQFFLAVSVQSWPAQLDLTGLSEPSGIPNVSMAPADNWRPTVRWFGVVLVLAAATILALSGRRGTQLLGRC
jgi:hypothetical protein